MRRVQLRAEATVSLPSARAEKRRRFSIAGDFRTRDWRHDEAERDRAATAKRPRLSDDDDDDHDCHSRAVRERGNGTGQSRDERYHRRGKRKFHFTSRYIVRVP